MTLTTRLTAVALAALAVVLAGFSAALYLVAREHLYRRADDRLAALMGGGGIQECGYAQNCVEICPKDIPLTRSISEVGGAVMKQALGDLFRR